MQKLMLLGDEAIAQGAIDAGLSGVYAYPGTPSTEITQYIQDSKLAKERNIQSSWSVNEKTSMEAALGMSYAGKRALVCMKHVGLNVAADAFVNSSITGVNGGVVVVAADDPSMHSSQNEQDSRFYAKFSMIPILEPSNQQEAYDMARSAFEMSEKTGLPIMIRLTTRLAHSRSAITRKEMAVQNEMKLPEDPKQFILLPAIARKRYKLLLEKQVMIDEMADNTEFNKYIDGEDKSIGIIACGLAYNYLIENFENWKVPYPVIKLSQYPLPRKMIEKLYDECDEIIVMEEGMPVVEEMIKGFLAIGKKIKGRLDGSLPRDGELNPRIVAKSIGLETKDVMTMPATVSSRPPKLCDGCPHIDSYMGLNEALKPYVGGRVFADIGCYTLGALEPYDAINTCVDMGASITMAKGAADAGLVPSVAVIGDSTFTHSGITGLLEAINDNSPITVFILDNSITAMTGCQSSAATGKVEQICLGLGVEAEHLKVIKPLRKQHEDNVNLITKELEYKGVSVIIPTRECIVNMNQKMRKKLKK